MEQTIVDSTYLHFYNLIKPYSSITVIFITTEKESRSSVTTQKKLQEIARKNPNKNIILLHYPHCQGVMAHQLNYALDYIRKVYQNSFQNIWIGVYNADSRIDSVFLNDILARINSDLSFTCYQQYSYFLSPTLKRKSIINSAALWQNRWSLLFEYARARFQIGLERLLKRLPSKFYGLLTLLFGKMNYVIGHGLFIRLDTITQEGGFSELTINEDAYLGLCLCNDETSIYPLPYFESAEFTNKLCTYIRQQAVWFNGPLYAFQYLFLYWKRKTNKCLNHFSNAFKLFLHSIYWLCSPLILLVYIPIVSFMTYQWIGILLWIIFVILYLPVVHKLVVLCLNNLTDIKKGWSKPSYFCVLAYFVHTFGPILTIVNLFRRKNNIDNKYKTERNDTSI